MRINSGSNSSPLLLWKDRKVKRTIQLKTPKQHKVCLFNWTEENVLFILQNEHLVHSGHNCWRSAGWKKKFTHFVTCKLQFPPLSLLLLQFHGEKEEKIKCNDILLYFWCVALSCYHGLTAEEGLYQSVWTKTILVFCVLFFTFWWLTSDRRTDQVNGTSLKDTVLLLLRSGKEVVNKVIQLEELFNSLVPVFNK